MSGRDRTESGRPVDVPESGSVVDELRVAGTGVGPAGMDEELHLLRESLASSHRNYHQLSQDFEALVNILEKRSSCPPSPAVPEGPEEARQAWGNVDEELTATRTQLEEARRQEADIKRELLLDGDAGQGEVLDRITEYRKGKKLAEKRLTELRQLYKAVQEEKSKLQRDLKTLYRAQQKHEEQQRQRQRWKLEKLMKEEMAPPVVTISLGGEETAPKTRARNTPRGGSRPGSNSNNTAKRAPTGPGQRCVLCREPYLAGAKVDADLRHCQIHYHNFKNGAWKCCGGKGDTKGCIRVPHVRVELTRDTVSLTDGNNSMELE